MSEVKFIDATQTTIVPPPNPWARISEIAAKVGVEPIQFGHPATITAMGADGKAYDVWEVISRVLDRIND